MSLVKFSLFTGNNHNLALKLTSMKIAAFPIEWHIMAVQLKSNCYSESILITRSHEASPLLIVFTTGYVDARRNYNFPHDLGYVVKGSEHLDQWVLEWIVVGKSSLIQSKIEVINLMSKQHSSINHCWNKL